MDVAALLEDLSAVPSLEGCRCRDYPDVFDAAVGAGPRAATWAARHQAIQICRTCPALTLCAAWVASLEPANRPLGVVAARINPQRQTVTDPWADLRRPP